MANRKPQISVIMSIYNQWNEEQLKAAINSILEQSFSDFEFIIYNDGSEHKVCEYLQFYEKVDRRIRIVSNPINHGLAYSLNTCIDIAQGKYLARMDDDDICAPNRLLIQYEYMEKHPEISFIGCNAKLIDDKGEWGTRVMPEYPDKHDFLRFSPYIHPTVMIRRNLFDDEEAYCASRETWRCEDYELFMRLWGLGYKGYNLQQDLFYYREDRNSYRKRKFKYRMDEMRLRKRNFNEMNLLGPLGWIYVFRPLAAAIVPSGIIYIAKKMYHKQEKVYEERVGEETISVQKNLEKRPNIV